MSNRNKILVGCLALLLVLSIGYALFSETITINGTATAKGDFDIIGSCQSGVPSELVSGVEVAFDSGSFEEKGYKLSSCSINGNEGTFSVEFEYPGAVRYFTVKLTNNGSIPAVMGNINTEIDDVCLDGNCMNNNPGYITEEGYKYINMFDGENVVGVQIADGAIIPINRVSESQAAEFMDADENIVLKPGNSVFVAIKTSLDSRLGNKNGGSIDASTTGTISFPFTQATNE